MELIPKQIPLDQIQDKIRRSEQSTNHMFFAAVLMSGHNINVAKMGGDVLTIRNQNEDK